MSGLNTWRYTYNIRQSKGAVSNSLLSNDTAPFDIMAAICNVPGVTVLAFRTPYALLIVAFLLLQRAMSAVALFFLFGLLLAQDLYRASRQVESQPLFVLLLVERVGLREVVYALVYQVMSSKFPSVAV